MFWNRKPTEEVMAQAESVAEKKEPGSFERIPLKDEDGRAAKEVLQQILNAMEFITSVDYRGIDPKWDVANLEITGEEDPGRVIGKDGMTLDALQILVSSIASHQQKKRVKVNVECNDYRKKREEAFIRTIQNMVDNVKTSKREITLDPMSASERFQVHSIAGELGGVTTASHGEGRSRRIVISPA
jgi:spoIIIJ-associated protein